MFPENKARHIFRKTNISYSLICTRTCPYQGVRNVRFSENLACFVFLKDPFWDSPFCLITDDFLKKSKFNIFLSCLIFVVVFLEFLYSSWYTRYKYSAPWPHNYISLTDGTFGLQRLEPEVRKAKLEILW